MASPSALREAIDARAALGAESLIRGRRARIQRIAEGLVVAEVEMKSEKERPELAGRPGIGHAPHLERGLALHPPSTVEGQVGPAGVPAGAGLPEDFQTVKVRQAQVQHHQVHPAVTEQAPYDSAGKPFPTTYYLTCPQLVAAINSANSSSGADTITLAAGATLRTIRSRLSDAARANIEAVKAEILAGGIRSTRAAQDRNISVTRR